MKDAIRHLDKRFEELRPLLAAPRPPKGWVRAVRDSLGMTTKQLALRMGVAQPRITELEKAEVTGAITLNSLERAAEALGCRVAYVLLPDELLTKRVEEQANRVAERQWARTQQTMMLENQAVEDPTAHKEMIQKLVEELYLKPARLWDET